MTRPSPFKLKIQIMCGDEIAMGPGKADLLDAIAAHCSISAAGRAMGMSYRRTWLLVDAMNRCWQGPLVATTPGNQKAGAHLTPLGERILGHYRKAQSDAEQIGSAGLAAITGQLLHAPRPPKRSEGPTADDPSGAA
ncbi:molybdate transport system regulatory protein [Blastomonas natatoria]|jgi:molybdate transport system regulatory protein|uniref:Molybdate transport system regulatory protein n=1 Tax=Blastomonas natatoria TaxID=34015 RepID=A0A2V3UVK6_9SPHN|nr:LysR family transcriptional regulator [Blastomonas natatoria]PXW73433.1 molybdate transport system regulatory protein [Blastomonas natatoria]